MAASREKFLTFFKISAIIIIEQKGRQSTMNRTCCICGREIKEGDFYYKVDSNSYTCGDQECYNTYQWNKWAERFQTPNQHEYLVINNKLYQIGSNEDQPRGSGGRYYVIQFEDGIIRDTRSLWFIIEIPKSKRKIFKQNAHILQQKEGN